jgi:cellulose synthase (UDP-forming)
MLAVMGGTSSSRGMRHAFWAEVYETALAPYIAVVTLLALVFPRHGKFNVTVKGAQLDRAQFDWHAAAPNLVVLVVCVLGIIATPWQMLDRPQEVVTLALTAAFNAYNVLVLLAAVAVALERPQQRRAHRVRREVAVRVWDADHTTVLARGRTRDLTEEGLGLVMPTGTTLPRDVCVSLETDAGWSPPVAVRVMSTFVAGGELNVGMLLDANIGLDQRRTIIETMFSSPDSWTVKGQHATATSALVGIVKAPWRAMQTNWRGRREPERAA